MLFLPVLSTANSNGAVIVLLDNDARVPVHDSSRPICRLPTERIKLIVGENNAEASNLSAVLIAFVVPEATPGQWVPMSPDGHLHLGPHCVPQFLHGLYPKMQALPLQHLAV